MNQKKHLSLFGIGPFYAVISVLLTVALCLLSKRGGFVHLSFNRAKIVLKIVSVFFFLVAAFLWVNAVFVQKIDSHIIKNELVTTGAYAWVRNPIYSAIMLVMWAVLAWQANLFLLLFYPVYPLLMYLLLKPTEEKWLAERYKEKYLVYCKEVNRCIPWFPKQKGREK